MIPRPNDREFPRKRIRASGYVRVCSSGDYAIVSLCAERKAIQQFAEEHGIEMVVWCTDTGQGGYTLDRPGLQDLLSRARSAKPPFDIVIVHTLGRLTRSRAGVPGIAGAGH